MKRFISTATISISPGPEGSISPPENPFMGGWGSSEPIRGKSKPGTELSARCLVIWDEDKPHAIVSADVLAFPRSMHQEIRSRVLALNGAWHSSDFVLQATHTHTGPVLVDVLEPSISYGLTNEQLVTVKCYSDWLVDAIERLVKTALTPESRVPCRLFYALGKTDLAVNRENLFHYGVRMDETDVPVLMARDELGKLLAVLFCYGCHPITVGSTVSDEGKRFWDGDFPARARNRLEKSVSRFAMYLQGPAGDQNPRFYEGYEGCEKAGALLAGAVLAVLDGGRPLDGSILSTYDEVKLPLKIANTDERKNYKKIESSGSFMFVTRHATRMIARGDDVLKDTPILPFQLWKFQDSNQPFRMIFMGGELMSGYAVRVRESHGGSANLLVAAYANEVPSYIPPAELLKPVRKEWSYGTGWNETYPLLAGGCQCVYNWPGPYDPSIEPLVDGVLDSLART